MSGIKPRRSKKQALSVVKVPPDNVVQFPLNRGGPHLFRGFIGIPDDPDIVGAVGSQPRLKVPEPRIVAITVSGAWAAWFDSLHPDIPIYVIADRNYFCDALFVLHKDFGHVEHFSLRDFLRDQQDFLRKLAAGKAWPEAGFTPGEGPVQ